MRITRKRKKHWERTKRLPYPIFPMIYILGSIFLQAEIRKDVIPAFNFYERRIVESTKVLNLKVSFFSLPSKFGEI